MTVPPPLVYKHTVVLPPVLTLAAVLMMGSLFGVLGLLVATHSSLSLCGARVDALQTRHPR